MAVAVGNATSPHSELPKGLKRIWLEPYRGSNHALGFLVIMSCESVKKIMVQGLFLNQRLLEALGLLAWEIDFYCACFRTKCKVQAHFAYSGRDVRCLQDEYNTDI